MKLLQLLGIVLIFIGSSCGTPSEKYTGKTVSVSILPLKYFVESIAGDRVKVNVMIPPGASHSTYEPTARQMNLLVNSTAYLKIGHLDFELTWMPRFTGINSEMKVFNLSEGIELLKGNCEHSGEIAESQADLNENGVDPHTWMSPGNAKIIATNTLNSLSSVFPADSAVFNSNYRSFLVQLNEVDSLYRKYSDTLKGRSFIIYHPALAYLARDYGMEQIVLEFNGKEPPPAHIKEIIDLAREKNIHTIFVQQQFSIDNSRSLASEINAEIVRIDPLDEDWKGQMISILNFLLKN